MKFVTGEAKVYNTSVLAFGVGPDNKNSSINIAHTLSRQVLACRREITISKQIPRAAPFSKLTEIISLSCLN
jgi:hypothetical protein